MNAVCAAVSAARSVVEVVSAARSVCEVVSAAAVANTTPTPLPSGELPSAERKVASLDMVRALGGVPLQPVQLRQTYSIPQLEEELRALEVSAQHPMDVESLNLRQAFLGRYETVQKNAQAEINERRAKRDEYVDCEPHDNYARTLHGFLRDAHSIAREKEQAVARANKRRCTAMGG